MEIKLIIVKRKTWLLAIKNFCIIFSAAVFWTFITIGVRWSQPLSDIFCIIGLLSFIFWIILVKYFTYYSNSSEIFLNTLSIKIISNGKEVVINQPEIIQVRIFYKYFSKRYERNNSSVGSQMKSTRNVNRIKIKTKSDSYNFHFYLDYDYYFDDFHSVIETMKSNGIDVEIKNGYNFITRYLDENFYSVR